jgi:hypothetical protein
MYSQEEESNKQTHTDSNQALDSQIDDFIKEHITKLNGIIGTIPCLPELSIQTLFFRAP